jgi:hypothetical protein
MKILVCISLVFLSLHPSAKVVEGLDFSDKLTIEKNELHLNGIGIRKATWFKVKVYVGGLYLKKKSNDVTSILGQDYPKFIEMRFVRNVDKDKLVGGWSDGFKAALSKKELTTASKEIASFNSLMSDIKKKQTIRLIFLKDAVKVSFNSADYTTIKSKSFSKRLLSIWFVKPRDKGLAKGLQGLK